MELIVKNYNIVDNIEFNYEEIKQELVKKLDNYKGVTYTEESLKLAKEDRAELNKIAKTLNARRLELEKEYMKPFNIFKDKVKELINLTNETSSEIDGQVKAFEEKQRENKLNMVSNIIQQLNTNKYPIDILYEEKYLLKNASEKSIKEDIERKIAKFDEDLQILKDMQPVDFEDIKNFYFRTNLSDSIKELNRIKELANKIEEKVEEKFKEIENPIISKAEEKEKIEEFNLTVFCTKEQFEDIKRFLYCHNIKNI